MAFGGIMRFLLHVLYVKPGSLKCLISRANENFQRVGKINRDLKWHNEIPRKYSMLMCGLEQGGNLYYEFFALNGMIRREIMLG